MTDHWLSCRNIHGDEVERLGPFDEIILRPGSSWIEVRDPTSPIEGGWRTISIASSHRVLILSGENEAPPQPDWVNDPW